MFLGETKIPDDKRKQLMEALEFLNTFLEGKKWFCGDNVTIADLSLLASFANVVVSFFYPFGYV
jgi:glutathione S-transferase